ncbi:MAG: MerR family transcriptional regulator [Anaerolineae bacterium]|nr:MerR family transcriptional regulator [Anaerolineae bacterium]
MEPRTITISDIPNEPQYTIKTVSKQTGILPVTIRAWERRYTLLTPKRADNRYRLYSERDIAILKWIQNSINSGVSISRAVSNLKTYIDHGYLPEVPQTPALFAEIRQTHPPAYYANHLYKALLGHDDTAADKILQEAYAIFDMLVVFEDILLPCMFEIGEAWYRGELSVTSEHRASNFIKAKLMSLLQTYPNRRKVPSVLVGCAPFEQHEIGPLMLAILLRRMGHRVEYLGPDIPLDDLLVYVREERPAVIVLSATLENNALELAGFEQKLRKMEHAPVFGYGGASFNLKPELREKVGGIFLGKTLREATQRVHALLKKSKRR